MKAVAERWNIIAVGKWNPHIFTPNWVARNSYFKQSEETIQVEVLISPEINLKFNSDNIILTPKLDRLIVGIEKEEDEILQNAENIMKHTLTLLNHTPVVGLGINFYFIEAEPDKYLLDLFDLKDKYYIAKQEKNLLKSRIFRSLDYEPWVLNLTIEFDGNAITTTINFHSDVNNASEAADKLNKSFIDLKNKGLYLLENVYGLTWKENDIEDEGGYDE